MFLASYYPDDGQPRPASTAGTYKFRHETIEEAKKAIEDSAKALPERRFTAFVVDEDAMKIVAWTKYRPRPIVEWVDPEAEELLKMFNNDSPKEMG